MNNKEFKYYFGKLATQNNFKAAFSGWLKESEESIVVLELQKSNFGNYYDLNIKIYVQGMFGNKYRQNKNLVINELGDIFMRQPNEYNILFDFDIMMDDNERKKGMEKLFDNFIMPICENALTKKGIKNLAETKKIFLLPAIEQELKLICDSN